MQKAVTPQHASDAFVAPAQLGAAADPFLPPYATDVTYTIGTLGRRERGHLDR